MPFKTAVVVCLILVAAGSLGLRRVRAEISEVAVQPFTALQTQITRDATLKVPTTSVAVFAASGDGLRMAILQQNQNNWRDYPRTIWNRMGWTRIKIDPEVRMLVVLPYYEPEYFRDGDWFFGGAQSKLVVQCNESNGTPDGQIEGFDVYRTEPRWADDPNNPGGLTTERRWAAPKLGCYVLRSERLMTDKDGKLVRSNIFTLTEIKIGEPDPSYFDTSLPNGYTRVAPGDYQDALVSRAKATREQQPR